MGRSLFLAVACALCAAALPAFAQLPPCKVGDVTRTGLPPYDAQILQHDPAKGLYRVRYLAGVYKGDEQWVPPTAFKQCAALAAAPVPLAFFHGRWELFTGGGAYSRSAEAPPLRIRDDGSYTWVIDSRTEIDGDWRAAQPGELKYGYDKRGTTAILLKGEGGKNWLVSREIGSSNDGRDAIRIERQDLGLTYRGYRTPPPKK